MSTDTHFCHKAWHDSSDTIGKIKYYMVGDQTGTITNNFGVMREGQGLADRATFPDRPAGCDSGGRKSPLKVLAVTRMT